MSSAPGRDPVWRRVIKCDKKLKERCAPTIEDIPEKKAEVSAVPIASSQLKEKYSRLPRQTRAGAVGRVAGYAPKTVSQVMSGQKTSAKSISEIERAVDQVASIAAGGGQNMQMPPKPLEAPSSQPKPAPAHPAETFDSIPVPEGFELGGSATVADRGYAVAYSPADRPPDAKPWELTPRGNLLSQEQSLPTVRNYSAKKCLSEIFDAFGSEGLPEHLGYLSRLTDDFTDFTLQIFHRQGRPIDWVQQIDSVVGWRARPDLKDLGMPISALAERADIWEIGRRISSYLDEIAELVSAIDSDFERITILGLAGNRSGVRVTMPDPTKPQ